MNYKKQTCLRWRIMRVNLNDQKFNIQTVDTAGEGFAVPILVFRVNLSLFPWSDLDIDRPGLDIDWSGLNIDRSGLNIDQSDLNIDCPVLKIDWSDLDIDRADLDIDQADLNIDWSVLNIDCPGLNIDWSGSNIDYPEMNNEHREMNSLKCRLGITNVLIKNLRFIFLVVNSNRFGIIPYIF